MKLIFLTILLVILIYCYSGDPYRNWSATYSRKDVPYVCRDFERQLKKGIILEDDAASDPLLDSDDSTIYPNPTKW